MIERTCELHGIPPADVLDYLTRLGGQPAAGDPPTRVDGAGWQAHITHLPDYQLGQAAFCSVKVVMRGEEAAVREVWRRFELCVTRPGG